MIIANNIIKRLSRPPFGQCHLVDRITRGEISQDMNICILVYSVQIVPVEYLPGFYTKIFGATNRRTIYMLVVIEAAGGYRLTI
jgi:hypothetical protein